MTLQGMTARFFGSVGLAAAMGAVSWFGCGSGSSGGSSGSQGSAGGSCYPNGTCNSGLDCSAGTCITGGSGSSSGGSSGEGSGGGSGGGNGGDSGPSAPSCITSSTCNAFPILHPITSPGVYCPFTATGGQTCIAGQTCCDEPASAGASTCNTASSPCPSTALSFRCMGDVDCQGSISGDTCCFIGTPCEDTTCGYFRIENLQATVCASICAAGQFHACEATSECAGSEQCVPTKTAGDQQMGVCF
jgi:hypothetical protein